MKGLLSDVRILDLTRMLAGPYGTMILADMGAEMIKVEDHRGDYTRRGVQTSLGGMGAYFLAVNRNKKSVVLDLKVPKGREIFYEMVKVSDVVVDNMRPQALSRLKCDYETLKEVNPRIISCSLSGFGHTGPYKDRPSFDLTVQALSGGMSVTGEVGGPPVRMGIPIGDLAGGLFSALSIVSALHFREKTGKGQKLDISLLDCQISMTSYLAAYYLIGGLLSGPQGSRHGTLVPYEAFKTKDIWIVVACVTEPFWEGLCVALELEELVLDDRFNNALKRLENHDELIPILQEVFFKKTAAEWLDRLEEADVPCAPVNSLDRALTDPQVLSRNMVPELSHPHLGKFKLAGNPVKASETEEVFIPPPQLGENTEEVFKQILGYSEDKIKELLDEKVIGIMKEEGNE
ncbi:MAG: CoA transferase [Deltaproteobacteria bacterium]|nr:CoA transferase [Deltaproteobacteria bacterium]MBW2051076.1 CoA transferase [Deltaproteobacteria bacterium]MBW2141056.1 CoA transferase [Deltaproteobacteria bacterium]MBW2322586.1 CoA transferase [Deltaproteobacteria bacterium]